MKKLFAFVLFVALSGAVRAAGIGVMDPARINDEARVMKSLNGQKDKAVGKIQSEVEAKRKDFEKKERELSTKQGLLSDEAFMKEAAKFRNELVDYDRQTAGKIAAVEKAYVEALKKVQEDYLDPIARNIGKEKGFDVVINAQAVIPINSSLDITSEVIERLDDKVEELELKIK